MAVQCKAVLFDFNGTMIFDSPIHEAVWMDFIPAHGGAPLGPGEYDTRISGRTNDRILTDFFGPMSREEIDRAVREAQQYAQQDAHLKAEATARDRCEQLLYQAGAAKNLSRDGKAELGEAMKNVKKALRTSDAEQMLRSADALEAVMQRLGVEYDPNREYSGSASYQNPNDSFSDDAVDADYEEVSDQRPR